MTWDEWQRYDIRALLWIMDARNTRIERSILELKGMIRQLVQVEYAEMITGQEVLDKVSAVKDRADAENELLDHIGQMLRDVQAQIDPQQQQLLQQALDEMDVIRQGAVDAITRNTDAAPNAGGGATAPTASAKRQ